MQVRLQFRLSDDEVIEGAALQGTLPDARRAALRAQPYLAGTLWLEHEGQPAVEILDDLAQLVPSLCIWSRPPLGRGEAVTVDMFISGEHVTLQPQGDRLKVVTTWEVEALLPLADCIDELRRCGHGFVDFVDRHLGDEPDWREQVDQWRRSLQGMGELPPPALLDDTPDPNQVSDEVIRQILAEQSQQR